MGRSEAGTLFALPWFLTWFGHSLSKYSAVVRMYDFFLCSPPLMPLYVAATIVLYRADEVLETPCQMDCMHALLSQVIIDFMEIILSFVYFHITFSFPRACPLKN
jgi:TBC1 domain family member 20